MRAYKVVPVMTFTETWVLVQDSLITRETISYREHPVFRLGENIAGVQPVDCPALVIGDAGPKMRNGTRQQMPMEIGSLASFVTYVRRRRAAVHHDSPCAHAYPMPSEAFEKMFQAC